MATWRSGYAADCKSAHPGSIPGVASTFSFDGLSYCWGVALGKYLEVALGKAWPPVYSGTVPR
jgi:hypothetical protein